MPLELLPEAVADKLTSLVRGGAAADDPNAYVRKVALENGLTPQLVRRLCEAMNLSRQMSGSKNAESTFTLADADEVLRHIHAPEQEVKAAVFAPPRDWAKDVRDQSLLEPLENPFAKQAAAAPETGNVHRDVVPRLDALMQHARSRLDDERLKTASAIESARRRLVDLSDHFDRHPEDLSLARICCCTNADQASVVSLFDHVKVAMPKRLPRYEIDGKLSQLVTAATTASSHAVKMAKKYAALRDRYESAQQDLDELASPAQGGEDDDPFVRKSAAGGWPLWMTTPAKVVGSGVSAVKDTLSEVGKSVSDTAGTLTSHLKDKLFPEKPEAPPPPQQRSRVMPQLESSGPFSQLQEARLVNATDMLFDIMNSDEVLQDADPDQVLNYFNQLIATAPSLVDRPLIVRSALRKMIGQGGALEPYEIQQLADLQNGLISAERSRLDTAGNYGVVL